MNIPTINIFLENRTRILEIANKNIDFLATHNDIFLSNTAALSNKFIEIREGDSYHYQTITSCFVIYLMDYTPDTTRHYLISAESSAGISHPTLEMNISRLHKHDYLEMFYLISGELDFIIEGIHKRYHAGDCCFINQNVRHVEVYRKSFCAIYLSFRPDFIESFYAAPQAECSELLRFIKRNTSYNAEIDYLDFIPNNYEMFQKNIDELNRYIEHILEELLKRQPGYMDMISGYLKRLFALLQSPKCYTCMNTRFYQKAEYDLFKKTLDYIHSHKYKLTRTQISEALHYNGNYISDVFLQHTGVTLADYIRDVCLQEAASLLLNTELSITEIIHRLGFENRTTFYQQFKKKYGLTPGEYRSPPS